MGKGVVGHPEGHGATVFPGQQGSLPFSLGTNLMKTGLGTSNEGASMVILCKL